MTSAKRFLNCSEEDSSHPHILLFSNSQITLIFASRNIHNMDLKKILSIGGKPGLFKMVGQTKSGFVVESMTDGKRMPAFPSQQVSSLEEISVYTTGEDIPLKDVFKRIFEKEDGGRAPDHKADKPVIAAYFEEVLPEYDRDLVRQSDIRKVYRWYNELLDAGLMEFSDEEGEEGVDAADAADASDEADAADAADGIPAEEDLSGSTPEEGI